MELSFAIFIRLDFSQGKRVWIQIQGERFTTAYISFQPTETCT